MPITKAQNIINLSAFSLLFCELVEHSQLEQANDDNSVYYIIETEPITNKFISMPKDKGNFNCASFVAGIVEAALEQYGFPCRVTVHWHQGTTFMIKFDDSVLIRERRLTAK